MPNRFRKDADVIEEQKAGAMQRSLRLRRISAIGAVLAIGGLTAISGAVADNVKNAVAPNGIGEGGLKTVALPAGGGPATASVPYYIQATGNDNCDAADGTPATVTINVPAGVTASPSALQFTACGDADSQSVTFSATAAGTYVIPAVDASDADSTDDYGAAGTAFRLVVNAPSDIDADPGSGNVAPVVAIAAADAIGTEGDALSTSGAFSDADGDSLTLSADNTAGTFTDNNDGTWGFSLPTNDDVAQQTVTVTADDAHGHTASNSFAYKAVNGNPHLQNLSMSGANCTPTLSFSVTDPGSADTHSGTIGWGDLSAAGGFVGETYSGSHSYTTAGTYTVGVHVDDDDNGSDDASVPSGYTVYNIPSTILQPINYTGPRSLFKLGSTIPVKITVKSCGGSNVGTLAPQVTLFQGDSYPDGTDQEAASTAAPTLGTTMRYDATGGQYIYNLATKGLSAGDWHVRISDTSFASPVDAKFSLKK